MSEIDQWIAAGRHWDPGKELLMKYSNNFNLKHFFQKCNASNENQDMLLYELKKIAALPSDSQMGEPLTQAQPVLDKLELTHAHGADVEKEVERLNAMWKPKYKEMAGLRLQLMHFPTDDDRRVAAFRILDLWDEIREVWRRRDLILKQGALPVIPETKYTVADDPVKLVANRNNLRSRISKAERKKKSLILNPSPPHLPSASSPEGEENRKQSFREGLAAHLAKLDADIAKWRFEIDSIETKLSTLALN